MSNPIKITVASADEIKRLPVAKKKFRSLVENVCRGEDLTHAAISVVFVGSERMQELNNRFLSHDYPTDVLAFKMSEDGEALDGEVYICLETAHDQAEDFGVTVKEELVRLVVHGVLHLIGYDDSTEKERDAMLTLGEEYVQPFMQNL